MIGFPEFCNIPATNNVFQENETSSSYIVILDNFSEIIYSDKTKTTALTEQILSTIRSYANSKNFNAIKNTYYSAFKSSTKTELLEIILFIVRVFDEADKMSDAIGFFINFITRYFNCTSREAILQPIYIQYIRRVCERILSKYEELHQIYPACQVYKYMLKNCRETNDSSLEVYRKKLLDRKHTIDRELERANIIIDSKRKMIREGLTTLYRLENNPYNSQLHLKYWSPMTDYYNEADFEYVISRLSTIKLSK